MATGSRQEAHSRNFYKPPERFLSLCPGFAEEKPSFNLVESWRAQDLDGSRLVYRDLVRPRIPADRTIVTTSPRTRHVPQSCQPAVMKKEEEVLRDYPVVAPGNCLPTSNASCSLRSATGRSFPLSVSPCRPRENNPLIIRILLPKYPISSELPRDRRPGRDRRTADFEILKEQPVIP